MCWYVKQEMINFTSCGMAGIMRAGMTLRNESRIMENWGVMNQNTAGDQAPDPAAVEDEIRRAARAAHRARATAKKHENRVKELLPVLRAADPKKWGPADLEELITRLYDRASISHWTAPVIGTSRKGAEKGT
jgi:hypothetical protein